MKKVLIVILLLTPFATYAGDWQTIYDGQGRVTGRVQTDQQGRQTFYDAQGRVTERAIPNQSGTTFYGADGRVTGRVPRR